MTIPCDIDSRLSDKLANMSLFCAFLVVLLHTVFGAEIQAGSGVWWFYTLFQEQFIRIAVPFFFTAAGFLLVGHCHEKGWWKVSLKSRLKTLVIPYCSFVLIHFIILNIGKPLNEIDISLLSWMERFGMLLRQPHPGILWFVRTLFLFVLISPFIVATMRKGKIWGGLLLTFMQVFHILLYIFWPSNENWKIFFDYLFFFRGLCFFSVGIFLRFYPIVDFSKLKTSFIFGIAISLSVLRIILLFHGNKYRLYPLLVCFELPLWVASIWLLMPSHPLPKWLTSCSFPVYLLHPYVLVALQRILSKLFHVGIWNEQLAMYFTLAICTFAISCTISVAIRKTCPSGAKYLFGGR